jgi:hypothetical protein
MPDKGPLVPDRDEGPQILWRCVRRMPSLVRIEEFRIAERKIFPELLQRVWFEAATCKEITFEFFIFMVFLPHLKN